MDANHNSRRRFIKTASATALLAIGTGSLPAMDSGEPFEAANSDFKTGFDQQPLPYGYNALEPAIDATTMEIHYSKHAAAYAKNLKEAAVAEKVDMPQPVETLL